MVNDELAKLIKEKPWILKKKHQLNQYVLDCQQQLVLGNFLSAENALLNLTMELHDEERMIGAAFMRFDSSGDSVLSGNEIKFMLDYLGFPCTDKDVKDLVAAVDTDYDNTVSFDEFLVYVGSLGGSSKLFEVRRAQIEDRRSSGVGSMGLGKEDMRLELCAAGIDEDAQAYWSLTAHPSELESAAMLAPCQQMAVRHIRALARENHEAALPELKERVAKLGFTEVDLYMALAWIRELAPLIVHIDLDKIGKFLKEDTHYRNQFETNTSGGLLKTSARVKWERGLFGESYDKAKNFERPKYGVQNVINDYRGVMGCVQYGDSYIVLKDVRLRCTLSPEDSANLPAKRLSVPDFYAHVLAELQRLARTSPQHRAYIIVDEIAQEQKVNGMCEQDCVDCMFEAFDPLRAFDVVACLPHKETTEDSTQCQGGDVVARQGIGATTRLGDESKLREHSHDAQEKACHPESIKERVGIHVPM